MADSDKACVDVYWEYPYVGSFATRPYDEHVEAVYRDITRKVDLMLLRTGANFTPCFDPDRSVGACRRLGNARFHAVDYRHVEVFDALLGPLIALCKGTVDSRQTFGRVAEQLLTRSPLHLAYFLLTLLGVDMSVDMRTSLALLQECRTNGDSRVRFKEQLSSVAVSKHAGYFVVGFSGGPPRVFKAESLQLARAAFSLASSVVAATGAVFVLDARGGVVERATGSEITNERMQAYVILARGSCLMTDNRYADAYTHALGVVMARLRSIMTQGSPSRVVIREQLEMIAGHIFLPAARVGQHRHGQHIPSDQALEHICTKLERKRAAMSARAWDALTHAIAETLLERLGGGARWSDDTHLRLLFGADEASCIHAVKLLDELTVPIGALFMDLMSIPRLLTSDGTVSITAAGHAHTSTLLKALRRLGASPVHSSPVVIDQETGNYKKCVHNMPESYVPTFVDALLSVDEECSLTTRVRAQT